jgi:DNA polymerase III delta prime subunit
MMETLKALVSTQTDRNRSAMLENVRRFWIEGVLENSLHDALLIELGFQRNIQAVDHPWKTTVRLPDSDEPVISPESNILKLYEQLNGKLLILGDPGSGKTTTLLTLAQELLKRAAAEPNHPIPVIFNLSSWADARKPLLLWIVDELRQKYQVPRLVAQEWAQTDQLLLLLDGLDEVQEDAREACVRAINSYREEHGFVDVVICSRTVDYEALSNRLRLNGALVIQPLDDAHIDSWLHACGSGVAAVRVLLDRDENLRTLARSPLMLSIMALAYRDTPAAEIPAQGDLLAQREHLFDTYIQRMIERRGQGAPYTIPETRHYLRWVADRMIENGDNLLQIDRLAPDWLLPEQRERYQRCFRILMVCLMAAAWSLSFLPSRLYESSDALFLLAAMTLFGAGGAVMGWFVTYPGKRGWLYIVLTGIGLALLRGLSSGLATDFTLNTGLFIRFLFLNLVFGTIIAWFFERLHLHPDTVKKVDELRFSSKQIDYRMALPGFLGGMALGFSQLSLPALIGMVLSGLVTAAGILFVTGMAPADIQTRLRPNQGIRSSLVNALRIGPVTGAVFGLATTFPAVLTRVNLERSLLSGVGNFLVIMVMTMVGYGLYTVIQHYTLRSVLRRDRSIPARLSHFLEYAVSRILLRRVGGSYIFIHRYLMEHFASKPSP